MLEPQQTAAQIRNGDGDPVRSRPLTTLERYVDDEHSETDNIAAERVFRAVSIRQKYYRFLGADSGG